MFAVIKTGGKQYRVAANDELAIEKLTAEPGDIVAFEEVMMVGDGDGTTVGAPLVDGATVAAEVLDQARGPKLIAFKKRRRKNSRRKKGHRQHLTVIRVTEILTGGAKPKLAKAKKPAKAEADAAEAKSEKAEAAPKTETKEAAKAPAKTEAPKEKAEPKKAAPKTAAAKDDAPEPLFDTPKGDADDLKKISGVGPVLEKKLNALGITQYAQIAAFTADEIAKVDEVLNFKGRIERDDWLGQAKTLAEGGDA